MTPLSAWAANPVFRDFSVVFNSETSTYTACVTVHDMYAISGSGDTELNAVMRLRFELGRLHERLAHERGDMFWSFR